MDPSRSTGFIKNTEYSMDTIPTYQEVTVSVSMSSSFMIEVPEGASHDDIIEKAKREITLPLTSLAIAKQALKQLGIRVNGIDTNEWFIDEVEYVTD